MIVDTSALVAIVLEEPEAERLIDALAAATDPRMSAPTWLEACTVLDRRGNAKAIETFATLFGEDGRFAVSAFTAAEAVLAREAYRAFGKGSGHPAQLNYGDCMDYAAARHCDQPLLFKGRDFIHTDIQPALQD